jgi:phosphoglycolate phosphatase
MPRIMHVVWDWNGTLLDDSGLCVQIMNEMLGRRGLPGISIEFYKAVIEFPVILYYRKLGFDFLAEPFERISDEFVSLYQAGWRNCSLQKGVINVLPALKAAGVGQSVLSASLSGHLQEQLAHFGICGFLDAVTGAENHHGTGKLHIAKEHAAATGVKPESVLFIGDTEHDAEVAAEAGCGCLLVSYGHYGFDRLKHLGLPIAASAEDVLKHIESRLA